jgi:hypothetical protein
MGYCSLAQCQQNAKAFPENIQFSRKSQSHSENGPILGMAPFQGRNVPLMGNLFLGMA